MANMRQYKKGVSTKISRSFNSTEFDCNCKKPDCNWTLVDLDHVASLQKLRDKLGKPISINSGYRCPAHNKEVGGATGSMHVQGHATDIVVKGMDPNKVADLCEDFNGLGRYSTFTHIDSRPSDKYTKARWDFRSKK